MRKRLFVLTCVLGMSMLTACSATKATENEATESQVTESVAEVTSEEYSENREEAGTEAPEESAENREETEAEATEESAENRVEAGEEVTEGDSEVDTGVGEENTEESIENGSEVVQDEMSDEDAMAAIQAILAQAQKDVLEREQEEVPRPKEYNFPEGYDSSKYTWRQTTADRNLYFLESDKELVGKEFIGETFEEILQMAEDPTCDFDEVNFWNATCFKGLTIKDTEYLVSKGYTVDGLIDMIIENGVGNVYELKIW